MSETSVLTRREVVSVIRSNSDKIRLFGVKRLGLFGSFGRGEAGPDSDIDLLVEFDPAQKTFDNFIHLSFLLEEIFKRRIELVTVESLSPYIRPQIINEVEDVPLAA
jgi:hypothetical protein